jgi:extracellular factor (EF) 3-hydroxypalmitic acid methyl ester biosynthesis protein
MMHPACAMSDLHHGNGNGGGSGLSTFAQTPAPKKAKRAAAPTSEVKESQVIFSASEGGELRGALTHFTRQSATFELYGETVVLRTSETLAEFKISVRGETIYSGQAVVSNLVDNDSRAICEVDLDRNQWAADADLLSVIRSEGRVESEFDKFECEWQKLYAVSPEFKVAIADMQTYFCDLQLWLNQVEIGLQSQPASERSKLEHEFLHSVSGRIMRAFAALFEKFERLAFSTESASRLAHSIYAKRLLHPLVLCAPFMHRTYKKPLGYAGDYEMVRMMTLDPFQGSSLFAKLLNAFFLNTPPVVAHRNRIDTLVRYLESESFRSPHKKNRAKIFNLGCGPAAEIQRFLAHSNRSDQCDFTLLDFNDETIAFAQRTLTQIRDQNGRRTGLDILKKSVTQLIKNSAQFERGSYDLVYCAGLFDYLSDNVSTMLLEIFYDLVAPGGLVLVSNVDASNPSQGWMECVVDWYLVYRNAAQMYDLIPKGIARDSVHVFAEPSSVNIFAEIRKPENA